ncbi:universal stress protein, partial [Desulfosarcina sp.]|uniref:universal stress protein n=1 Tax=Desulfosarcina sp. TaxID=2027861 RepID=UPI0029BCFA5E
DPYPTKEKMDQIAAEDAYTEKRIFEQIDLLWAKEKENAPGSEDILDEFVVIPGNPVDEILKQARELACDAIAMGAHKKGLLRSLYFGGTTKKVLRKTKRPVIIIPLAGREKRPKWRPRLDNLATGLK